MSYRSYRERVEKQGNALKIRSVTEPVGSRCLKFVLFSSSGCTKSLEKRYFSEFHTDSQYVWTADVSVLNRGLHPDDCSSHENHFCLRWSDETVFEIAKITEDCERYEWRTSLNLSLTISFNLGHSQLYGGPEMSYQSWPVQNSPLDNVPYVTHDGPISQSVLCLLYTSPSPRDRTRSRMPSSA